MADKVFGSPSTSPKGCSPLPGLRHLQETLSRRGAGQSYSARQLDDCGKNRKPGRPLRFQVDRAQHPGRLIRHSRHQHAQLHRHLCQSRLCADVQRRCDRSLQPGVHRHPSPDLLTVKLKNVPPGQPVPFGDVPDQVHGLFGLDPGVDLVPGLDEFLEPDQAQLQIIQFRVVREQCPVARALCSSPFPGQQSRPRSLSSPHAQPPAAPASTGRPVRPQTGPGNAG